MKPGAFRFLLANLVVISHYSSFGIGRSAVLLFFSLSGYWVYQMWVKKYVKAKNPYTTYIVSRILRLAPVFILCSSIAIIVCVLMPKLIVPPIPFPPIGFDAFISSFIILGYNTSNAPPLGPAWSLDIELQFYIIAPLIIIFMQKRAVLLAFFVTAVGMIGLILWNKQTLLPFLPFFLIGMIFTQGQVFEPVSRRVAKLSAVAVVIVLVIFISTSALRPILFGGATPSLLFKFNDTLNVFITLLAIPFVMNTVLQRSDKLDGILADFSYSLYLFHYVPILIVGHYFPHIAKSGFGERLFWTLLILVLTYVVSLFITIWVDRPLNAWRAHFVKKNIQI